MSRCANHPSRPATAACATCGRPLCERCALSRWDRTFCSARCALLGIVRRPAASLRPLLSTPVPAPWALAIVAAAAALLLVEIVVLSGTLLSLSTAPAARFPAPPAPRQHHGEALSGRIVREGRRWTVEISGPPGTDVLIAVGGRPSAVLRLDEGGKARLTGLRFRGAPPSVRIVALAGPAAELGPPPTATPTRTPTPTATPTPTRTPTATPTATATVPPSPTPAAVPWTPEPSPGRPTLSRAHPSPHPTRPVRPRRPTVPDLELVPDAGPRIALTFDGGSDGGGAAQVLDALQQLGIHATLFVTGRFIRENPAIVRRALLEGHEVGNHTMHHPHLTTYERDHRQRTLPEMTRARFRRELLDAERLFLRATGRPMSPLWRAPYGEENATLRRWAAELGYLHVRWSLLGRHSLDSRDWVADEHSPLYEDADRMVRRLLTFPHLEGGLVLMHLASKRTHPAWSRLPALAEGLRGRGLEIVPVTELLAASPTWSPRLHEAARRHAATVRTLGPVR